MIKQKTVVYAFIGFMTTILFLSAAGAPATAADGLEVAFSWDGIRKCTSISPEIRVTNIPDGTASFEVRLRDLDVPDYNHGGGTVPNDGSGVIAKGALKADFSLKNPYKGPCPPMGAHLYEFTVKALDKGGKVLAEGKASEYR